VGPDQEQPAPSQAGGESAPLALPIIGAPRFTSREMEVLRLMAQGLRNKEIAETLVITERTVKIHVGNILNKLNASNRTEAVTTALKLGLL
jgi:DNA-binding NarL/FixJ family response regulator